MKDVGLSRLGVYMTPEACGAAEDCMETDIGRDDVYAFGIIALEASGMFISKNYRFFIIFLDVCSWI